MNTATKIKKVYSLMTKYSESYQEEKKAILNNPKIIEYLFNQPIIKRNDLALAIESLSDEFSPVRIDALHVAEIECKFIEIMQTTTYYIYISSVYKKLTNDKRLQMTIRQTSVMTKLSEVLDKFKVSHVYDWSFKLEEERLTAMNVCPYNFDFDLKVDIYGCIFKRSETCKMYQFAIIYDSKFKKLTTNDYQIQYYLHQMGIHLLRLNRRSKPTAEIKYFLKLVLKTGKYIIRHGLAIKSKINVTEDFHRNYEFNRKIYLKNYSKHKNDDLSVSDERERMEEEEPEGVLVNQDFMKSLLEKKYIFTKTNRPLKS